MYGIKRKVGSRYSWVLDYDPKGSHENVGPLLFPTEEEAKEYALSKWEDCTVESYSFLTKDW